MAEITDKTKTRIRKAQNPGHDHESVQNSKEIWLIYFTDSEILCSDFPVWLDLAFLPESVEPKAWPYSFP
jgi:hypothetical protein